MKYIVLFVILAVVALVVFVWAIWQIVRARRTGYQSADSETRIRWLNVLIAVIIAILADLGIRWAVRRRKEMLRASAERK